MNTPAPLPARHGNSLRPYVWGAAAAVLLLPLVAMQFTREVAWEVEDFIVMGALLASACGAYEVIARFGGGLRYRAAAGLALVNAVLLVWINLAVGFIGDEANPANLMYAGVLLVGVFGALAVRLRAAGMAWAMWTTAVAQGVVAVVAVLLGEMESAALTLVFALPWGVSGWLFGRGAMGAEGGSRA